MSHDVVRRKVMDIGETVEVTTIEPLEEPVPGRKPVPAPAEEPVSTPTPEPEPILEPVPA